AFRATHLAFYPIGLVLGLGIQPPTIALYTLIEKRFPTGQRDQLALHFLESGLANRLVIGAILVVLVPGLAAAFFRGSLSRSLRDRSPLRAPGLAIALLYALAHLEWQMMIPIAFVGVALGILRAVSGSLGPGWIAHVTSNSLAMVALALGPPDPM